MKTRNESGQKLRPESIQNLLLATTFVMPAAVVPSPSKVVASSSRVSGRLLPQPWQDLGPEDLDPLVLALADVVQGDLVEAQLRVLGELGGVPAEVGGDVHDLAYSLDRDVLGDRVEGLDGVDVPADRRWEDVAAPLLVGDRLGLRLVGRPAQVDLQVQPSPAARVPVGVDHPAQLARRAALTVISPSAHSAHQRAVSTLTAAPSSGGGSGGRVQTPRPVDADEAVVADLLAAQQRPDDVDALAQPGVA